MAEHLLALDLGTTGVRAVVFDAAGESVGAAYARLSVTTPAPDRVEQDADEFLRRSLEVMRRALAEAGRDVRDLRALGIVTQRSSVVAWDAQTGRPLAPVIGWQDRRTLARVLSLQQSGIPVNTLAACTKFEWLLQAVPEVAAAAAAGVLRLGTPDAWLAWALSGGAVHVTDPSNAGTTGLYDAERGDWFDPALALFGQDRRWHPNVVASDAVVGEVDRRHLGAPVPLAARAGDQQAACFAQGVHEEDDAKLTLGTSAMLDRCTGSTPAEAPQGAYALPLWRRVGRGDAFCVEGTVITAGAAVEWLLRTGVLESVEALDDLATAGRPGVIFVPALAGLGTPYLADRVRGRLDGLGLDTERADIVRGVVDGIAQRVADVADALGVKGVLRVDGGLARSRRLVQTIADLTGLEVRVAADVETTARGAAALAAASPDVAGDALPDAATALCCVPELPAADRDVRRGAWAVQLRALLARP
ncbi:MAG: FGGY family carbohydrate kinase [Pseudomonadales bacterium]|nr:FGGY family carbohydrate kinase [Pseudomonadales bacterium]